MANYRQKILNVGLNESLVRARSAILERAGYHVVSALNLLQIEEACAGYTSFDLVIIGQALPKPEKRRIMGAVRKLCGAMPILELYLQGTTPVGEEADEQLASSGEADTLLAKVAEVLTKKRNKRRAAY